jgi:tRNA(Ile)-lysidine synthase|tara:strand:+ start:594 stop:1613 length:1020 start_codon:yes stop_codon:yes gene_type:complete
MSKKDLNVLNLKSKILKDKKILNIYSIFKKNLNFITNENITIGVSGGPDSLALASLVKMFQNEKKIKVFFVLIDHGIRKNSSTEAIQVKKLLKKHDIDITILKNKEKIKSNIQSRARDVRYKLLTNFSKKNKVKYILTAHHSDDQVETFLIRLSRGSGVRGLSAMKLSTRLENKIYLVRPLLDQNKDELIYIAKKIFKKVFKDPSNKNKKYLRTRVRYLKNILEKNGIHYDQILKSIKNLASTRDTLDAYIGKIYKTNVKNKKKEIIVNFKNISIESVEIQIKILSEAIRNFSKSYYPPRSKKILNLIEVFSTYEKKKLTLAGCLLEKSGPYISIKKEA